MGDITNRLLSVKGMGYGRLEVILKEMNGKEGLVEVLKIGDVSRLASIEGISERMAVDLVLSYRGDVFSEIKGNEPAMTVATTVQQTLSSYMHTSNSRNKVLLMRPGGDLGENRIMSLENHRKKELLEGKDRAGIEKLLSLLDKTPRYRKRAGSLPYILVVEDEEAYDGIREKGLDSRCLVVSPEELTNSLEGTIILIHNRREIDEEMLPITASVHYSRPSFEIVPETVLDEMGPMLDRINAAAGLREIFGLSTVSRRAVDLITELRSLGKVEKGPDEIRSQVLTIKRELDISLKEEISKLTLSGDDALSILSSGQPEKLKIIYSDHEKKAASMVRERLSIRADLFRMRYPVEMDEEALDRIISDMQDRTREHAHERKVRIARELADMSQEVLKEQNWALDLDLDFGMGCFVEDLMLHPFDISEGNFSMEKAGDLMLRKTGSYQPVDYHLGKVPEKEDGGYRTALLTGANSGGKTTLLMTIAQIVMMANMGLPVPAEKASIPKITSLYIYRPKRMLDAGGLEGFLKELLPLSQYVDGSSMVLADELEAMTELEAASRIIGVFLKELEKKGAFSVIVTHMADEILRFANCRVDGIEAKGLDEKHNLIVDRTPRIGHHARSTPELIIRRLEAKASGKEKEVFSRVLKSFE